MLTTAIGLLAALAPTAGGADPGAAIPQEIRSLPALLEMNPAAAALRADSLLAAIRPSSRADSIALLIAMRTFITARLREARYDDPALPGRIAALAPLGAALYGPQTIDIIDARIDAGLRARGLDDAESALAHFRAALTAIPAPAEAFPDRRALAHEHLAETFFALERYTEAVDEYEQAARAREAEDADGVALAVTLVNLNEARRAARDSTGIAADGARARRILVHREGRASPRLADLLYREAAWQLDCHRPAAAAAALDTAIAVCARGVVPPELHGNCLLARAELHLGAEDPTAARDLALRARELFTACPTPPPLPLAACAMAIGHADAAAGAHDAATRSYREALSLYERLGTAGEPELVNCLRALTAHDLALAHYEDAADSAHRALALGPRLWGEHSGEVAVLRVALATTLHGLQLPDSARTLYEQAQADLLSAAGERSPLLVEPLLRLGTLARERGDLAEARAKVEQALALIDAAPVPAAARRAECHHELGIISRLLGDARAARNELELALQLANQGRRESEVQAAIHSSLALVARSVGDEEAAWSHFRTALDIAERVLPPLHPRRALILRNLASLANAQGRFGEARDLYRRALTDLEAGLGPDHPEVAATRLGLGNALKALGALAAARTEYETAIAIHRETLGPDAPALALDYHNLAALSLQEGALDAAVAQAETADALARAQFALVAQGLSEREALHLAGQRVRGADIALTVAGRVDDARLWRRAWDLVLQSRGVVLEELATRQQAALLAEDPALRALLSEQRRTSSELAHLAVRGCARTETPADFKRQLAAARGRKEAAERALAAASRVFDRRQEQAAADLSTVLADLPPGSALLAWVRYERLEAQGASMPADEQQVKNDYGAFVVEPELRQPRFVSLGSATEIDSLVACWRTAAARRPVDERAGSAGELACRDAGERLRRRVWDPAFPDGPRATRVFLVPDGSLCLVNFNALPAPRGGFLVDEEPLLVSLGTERELLAGDGDAVGRGLLAVGAPDYDGATQSPADLASDGKRGVPCGQYRALHFRPLPGTEREVAAAARLWRVCQPDSALALVGVAAAEDTLRALASGHRVLHFATHGYFLGAECATQAARRGDAEPDELTIGSLVAESPLLLSGMALSGANRREAAPSADRDGMLTAEEIAGLDLRGTALAVLSACGTGLGTVEVGEGVFGLRRAFRLAGVRALVMSLWAVDDAGTATWMENFFAAFARTGLAPEEALREADRQWLASRRAQKLTEHPFTWGAFIATRG